MNWVVQNCRSGMEIYFGGIHETHCVKLLDGVTSDCPELSSSQEEADDRLMFHINHGCTNGLRSALVLSPDADVLTGLLYHFRKTFTLNELYVRLGSGNTKKTVPLHILAQQLDSVLVENLPAIHALSGCDTTSKVGPKLACLKKSLNLELIKDFGITPMTESMINNAEKFLLDCLPKSREVAKFDDYRYEQYHGSETLDFNKLVCTSSTIKEHIKRAYYQCVLWYTAPEPLFICPSPTENYGYKLTEDNRLLPIIIRGDCRPSNLPAPCKCVTCVKSTCVCRQARLGCSKFCKCDVSKTSSKPCQNPYNQ